MTNSKTLYTYNATSDINNSEAEHFSADDDASYRLEELVELATDTGWELALFHLVSGEPGGWVRPDGRYSLLP